MEGWDCDGWMYDEDDEIFDDDNPRSFDDLDLTASTVAECPCGCGLKHDICTEQLARVKVHNDALPF